MQRRIFLATTALASAGFAASTLNNIFGEDTPVKTIAKGAKLSPPTNGLINVAFAISRGTTWIDWVGPQAAFQAWHFDPVQKKHSPRFKLFTVSEKLDLVDSLIPDYTFATAPSANIVVVPAQSGSDALIEWLKKNSETADILMSVCIGARHLAKAGLLDGKDATTHHESIDEFAKQFPNVNWIRGVRFVEGAKISTAGGLTSGIDLALRVIERYFDRVEAQKVADHLEYRSTDWAAP